MESDISRIGDVCVVTVGVKRLDAAVAPDFRSLLIRVLESGCRGLVLDLTRVEFIDSAGLGALVFGLKRMAERGRLVLCGVGAHICELLRIMRMDGFFRICSTPGEALLVLGGPDADKVVFGDAG